MLAASCENRIVKITTPVGEIVVPDAEIMSDGVGPSVGLLLLDRSIVRYIPSSEEGDLKETLAETVAGLRKTVEAIQKIATMFTSVAAGMTGPSTAPPPTLPADVVALGSMATELSGIATELETLEGALR